MKMLGFFKQELLLDIFELIHPNDLYRGWKGLNSRIEKMLRSISVSVRTGYINDVQNCLAYFTNQVIYLKGDRVLVDFDLSPLFNLRSLHFTFNDVSQADQITPVTLPHLVHLTMDNIYKMPVSFLNQLLFGSERFSHLIFMRVNDIDSSDNDISQLEFKQNTIVRHLSMGHCPSLCIGPILSNLPNLVSFKVSCSDSNNPLPSPSFICPLLSRMTINLCIPTNLYLVNILFEIASNLNRLQLHIDDRWQLRDFVRLSLVFDKPLPLKRVEIDVLIVHLEENDLFQIQAMSRWFTSFRMANVNYTMTSETGLSTMEK
jgi:hypothetical protein